MEVTAKCLLELRQSVNMSQEHNQQIISDEVILKYVSYFDVSLDYVCGRTSKPEGKLFTARPNIDGDNEEIRQFNEMYFDPKSEMSVKLKDTLYGMMAGD